MFQYADTGIDLPTDAGFRIGQALPETSPHPALGEHILLPLPEHEPVFAAEKLLCGFSRRSEKAGPSTPIGTLPQGDWENLFFTKDMNGPYKHTRSFVTSVPSGRVEFILFSDLSACMALRLESGRYALVPQAFYLDLPLDETRLPFAQPDAVTNAAEGPGREVFAFVLSSLAEPLPMIYAEWVGTVGIGEVLAHECRPWIDWLRDAQPSSNIGDDLLPGGVVYPWTPNLYTADGNARGTMTQIIQDLMLVIGQEENLPYDQLDAIVITGRHFKRTGLVGKPAVHLYIKGRMSPTKRANINRRWAPIIERFLDAPDCPVPAYRQICQNFVRDNTGSRPSLFEGAELISDYNDFEEQAPSAHEIIAARARLAEIGFPLPSVTTTEPVPNRG